MKSAHERAAAGDFGIITDSTGKQTDKPTSSRQDENLSKVQSIFSSLLQSSDASALIDPSLQKSVDEHVSSIPREALTYTWSETNSEHQPVTWIRTPQIPPTAYVEVAASYQNAARWHPSYAKSFNESVAELVTAESLLQTTVASADSPSSSLLEEGEQTASSRQPTAAQPGQSSTPGSVGYIKHAGHVGQGNCLGSAGCVDFSTSSIANHYATPGAGTLTKVEQASDEVVRSTFNLIVHGAFQGYLPHLAQEG